MVQLNLINVKFAQTIRKSANDLSNQTQKFNIEGLSKKYFKIFGLTYPIPILTDVFK